nr:hypothetical protein [Tanacetum cinerariifolium]
MQTTEEKVDTSKALDASSVDTESSRTESKENDTSSSSGNDAHDDDADIRPIYDEEPIAEVQTTTEIDVFAIGQQHTEQPEFNNEGEVVQNAKECHDTWKPMSQPHRNQSVVRQPTAFKSERPRISKPQCDFQVDMHDDLSKPVTTHYLPKEREAASTKPHHMIASSNSRINSRAKVPFNKTTNRNKPVEQKGVPHKQERQILTGHRFSIQKTSVVQKKTMTPKSYLRWKLTDKIFKTVGLRWVPTGRILKSSTTKVYCEPLNGSNADITNQYECEQTLDVSVELRIHNHDNELSSSKLVPNIVPPAYKTATSRQVLELLFHHYITMLSSELRIHNHGNELSSSKLVPNIVPPAYKTATSRQVLELLFHHYITMLRSTGLDDGVAASFQWSRIHHYMIMLKRQRHTKHQKFMNQESSIIKTKSSANSDKQDLPQDFKSIKGDC